MPYRRTIAWLLLLAVVTAANLHLPALQVVAWTRMLVEYSHDRSLSEAVEMTFDGEHPCPMCQSIKAAATNHADTTALDGVSSPQPLYAPAPATAWIHTLVPLARLDLSATASVRTSHQPPVPPPRSANA
jgi:hypothetical protein